MPLAPPGHEYADVQYSHTQGNTGILFKKTLKNNPQKAPAADNGAAAQQMNSWGFRFPPMIITVRSAICQKPGTTLDNPQNISVALCGVRVGRVSGDASFVVVN